MDYYLFTYFLCFTIVAESLFSDFFMANQKLMNFLLLSLKSDMEFD